MTVEAALLCPLILLILISFLELGVRLVLELRTRTLLEQTALYYDFLRSEGAESDEARIRAQAFLSESVKTLPLERGNVRLEVSDGRTEEKLRIQAAVSFRMLFFPKVTVIRNSTYLDAHRIRDILTVLAEDARKIPGSEKIWSKYEEYMRRWTDALR